MKKITFSLILTLSCFVIIPNVSLAQDSKQSDKEVQASQLKSLIDGQQYSFAARIAVPLSMPSRQLFSDYELKVSKDTIEAFLPFYGKTNSFEIGSDADGIKFKSKEFKYTVQQTKKGGWNIKITFKDAGDVKQMYLSISPSGYTSLQVTCQNKDSISFNGEILQ